MIPTFAPARSEQVGDRELGLDVDELPHPLLHHLDPVHRVHRNVAELVVLVPGHLAEHAGSSGGAYGETPLGVNW